MKCSAVAIVALASLSSTAWAQSATSSWRQEIERADEATMPHDMARGYVRNANSCAPDLARAVWGPKQVLLGYACYENSNR
jgi:hypothetical protein